MKKLTTTYALRGGKVIDPRSGLVEKPGDCFTKK